MAMFNVFVYIILKCVYCPHYSVVIVCALIHKINSSRIKSNYNSRGYFLTILVALYIRYRILNILKNKGVNGKLSVNEVLTELSRVYLITMGARRVLSEVTKKAENIEKILGMRLFQKILKS